MILLCGGIGGPAQGFDGTGVDYSGSDFNSSGSGGGFGCGALE
ncbi:hypothetical protein SAMN05216251_12775 [Actinacidiphila alni]|uniref:Uncharacterized protein n=1 Tax=Actinacidiphila alni TaxID=380248 RepID=A0A1I2L892_9ACTN|nr:hypothetical protein SAMN05216251_12775 [Actinacidiphila alni]